MMNRVTLLRELEKRMRNATSGGPNLFDGLEKAWDSLVPTEKAPPPEAEAPQQVTHQQEDSKANDMPESQPPEGGAEVMQITPDEVRENRTGGMGQTGSGNMEEVGVPETPENVPRITLPTQVSSPRNRKRALSLSDEGGVVEKGPNGAAIVRNLMMVRGRDGPADSPFPKSIRSIQACGDMLQPQPVQLPPAVVPVIHTNSQPIDDTNSDKVEVAPRHDETLQKEPEQGAQKKVRSIPENEEEQDIPPTSSKQ